MGAILVSAFHYGPNNVLTFLAYTVTSAIFFNEPFLSKGLLQLCGTGEVFAEFANAITYPVLFNEPFFGKGFFQLNEFAKFWCRTPGLAHFIDDDLSVMVSVVLSKRKQS